MIRHRQDPAVHPDNQDRKSTRLNSSHSQISYAVFCLKKKKKRSVCIKDTNRSGASPPNKQDSSTSAQRLMRQPSPQRNLNRIMLQLELTRLLSVYSCS